MMLSNAQVFVLVSSIFASALGKFTSPTSGVDHYRRQYTTIEIPWKFDNDGKIGSVEWRYKKLDSSGAASVIYIVDSDGNPAGQVPDNQFTNRIEFRGDIPRKDVTLAIRNFVKDDEGVFTCEVRAAARFDLSVTIKATVLSNVTEFKTIGYNNSEIVQGDNITLSCTTTMGQPSPRVEIRKGNTLKNSTTADSTGQTSLLYHFNQISKDEEGSYSCQVTTERFTSEKSLQLDVKYPPEIDSSVKTEQFGCLGRQIMINCRASGDPKPVVIIIGPDGKSLPKNEFMLKEFGTYRCEASNKLGNDSLNITVSQAKEKPEEPSFVEDCSFTKLRWKASSDKGVKYTLQVREEGSDGAWGVIITSIDTSYSPSTNESLSKKKDYVFRVIATNCRGSTESKECVVKGQNPSPESRSSSSSNAGIIAGSVIAVLFVILIIVVAAVYFRRKKRRESPTVRLNKRSPPTGVSDIKSKPGGLLYSDSPNMDAPRVRPPVEYRQDEDEDDGDDRYENDPTVSQNVPSWV